MNKNVKPEVPAEHFAWMLHDNVDNQHMTDTQFREFVRNSLPVVIYPRTQKDNVPA